MFESLTVAATPLESTPPGLELAAILASADVRGLPGLDLVAFLSACERQATWAQARQLDAIRELARRRPAPIDPSGPDQRLPDAQVNEFAHLEIAAELSLSHRSAAGRLELAIGLDQLPATTAALAKGEITVTKAEILLDTLRQLDDAALIGAAEARLLVRAPDQTPARLRAAAPEP